MHFINVLICTAVVLAGANGAQAVLTAEKFVALRLIEDVYDRTDQPPSNRSDGTIYRTGGITNDGDLFGDAIWDQDLEHREHFEQPVRWLRSTGYKPEIVNGGMEHILHPCCGGEEDTTVVPGESFWGLHSGDNRETPGRHMKGVTAGGFAIGSYHVNNMQSYHYDIKNDVLTHLGVGLAAGGNDNGLVVSSYSNCCGAHSSGYYSKVLSIDPEKTNDKHEVASWYPTFGFDDPFTFAINNQNIIVGNVGSLFTAERRPMKMVPTGEGTWSDPIELESFVEDAGGVLTGDTNVLDISNNVDRPFAVGAIGSPQSHAVIWDVNDGSIVADFGNLTMAWQISNDGTKVAGIRKEFAIPPRETPVVWSTDDGWASFTELDLNEALDWDLGLKGADIWEELTRIDGVNDSGQVVGTGTVWPPDGDQRTAVFLLDTLALSTSVLKGDVNDDGSVDNLDITPFIAALAAADEAAFLDAFPEGNYAAADIDMSGGPNNLDITPFIGLLTAAGSNATAVPEPSSLVCVVLALMMGPRRTVRRCRSAAENRTR